jgi:hypothetical protein
MGGLVVVVAVLTVLAVVLEDDGPALGVEELHAAAIMATDTSASPLCRGCLITFPIVRTCSAARSS